MVNGYAVFIEVNGVEISPCKVALPLEIRHGRSTINNQPDSPSCSFAWLDYLPPGNLGDTVTVYSVSEAGATWGDEGIAWADPDWSWLGTTGKTARFVGTITELKATESGGEVTGYDVECTGIQSALGFLPVLLSRPVETDVARVQAIAADAGVPITIVGMPSLTLAADNIDKDALSAIHEVCKSSGGLFWQNRFGELCYGTMNHRDVPTSYSMPCSIIVDGIGWTDDIDQIINHVTVKWGPTNSQTQQTFSDPDSIDQWGKRHVDVGTLCESEVDASLLGLLILARRKQPYWRMPGAVVTHRALASGADVDTLAAMEVSVSVAVPIETEPSFTPGAPTQWIVEGWVESWDESDHRIQFALSDAARSETGGIRNWAEMRDQGLWSKWAAGMWIEALVEV